MIKRTALKAGSHKDDQITLESPDIAEIKTNCRKWLTSPKILGILILDIKYSNKKEKGGPQAMKKPGKVYTTGFARIMNGNSFPSWRYHLIFISQRA